MHVQSFAVHFCSSTAAVAATAHVYEFVHLIIKRINAKFIRACC
jgi:hypothetical protein